MSQDQALINFQANHSDHLGVPLIPDGRLGPRTLWAMGIAALRLERKDAIYRARGCLGIKEIPMGSNRSPDIDYWLKRCGIAAPPPGVPAPDHAWCAAAASWIISTPDKQVTFARVYDFVHKSKYKQVTIEEVLPGDFGCILRPDDTGHIWMIAGKSQRADGTWVTMNYEGNTGNAFRCTLREHTPRTMYLQTFPEALPAGIIETVPFAGSSTT